MLLPFVEIDEPVMQVRQVLATVLLNSSIPEADTKEKPSVLVEEVNNLRGSQENKSILSGAGVRRPASFVLLGDNTFHS